MLSDGSNLKALRKAKGLSMKAVGDALGLHFTTIDKLERGKRRLSGSHVVALARLYDVNVSTMACGDDVLPLTGIVALLGDESIPAEVRAAAAAEKLTRLIGEKS